jgi:hypothetical protein
VSQALHVFRSMLLISAIYFCLITTPIISQSISKPNIIGFISDTQAPIWIEKLWVKSNRNEEATEAIFNRILQEENIVALFHLGDITPYGGFHFAWDAINLHLAKLEQAHIPIYPVPGNHEYYFPAKLAISQFKKRFPQIKNTWYSVQINNTVVILLNSNFSNMSETELTEQKKWYSESLEKYEKDPTVRIIIVGTHYSPFTNSTIVEPSEEVELEFVKPFLANNKCKLFLSGHAHAFEHFKKDSKDFLVIGGGGGLQQPLLTANRQRMKDYFPFDTPTRMFHFLTCEEKGDSLFTKVIMLKIDFKTFYIPYEIKIGI